VVTKVPRFTNAAEGNDLADVIRDTLLLGPDKTKTAKKDPAARMPTLNPDLKSEAYDSENEFDDLADMTDADGTGNQGFRVRKDEEYEKDQEWKR